MSAKRKRDDSPLGDACDSCKSMSSTTEGLMALLSQTGFKRDYIEINQSSNQGCPFCRLVTKGVDQWPAPKISAIVRYTCLLSESVDFFGREELLAIIHGIRPKSRKLARFSTRYCQIKAFNFMRKIGVIYHPASDRRGNYMFDIDMYAPEGDPVAAFLDVKASEIYTPESLLVKKIKDRFTQCRENHRLCDCSSNTYLPTRLLKVGNDSEMPGLYTSRAFEKGQYIALSYCWGGPQKLILTSTSELSRMIGFPLTLAPKTIQDAIKLTRLLGFEYLWVDALCIIQDSEADKVAEINAMGSIYKNAAITIAAANAASVDEGFLSKSTSPLNFELPFMAPTGHISDIFCDSSWGCGEIPYTRRGWTFQEALLSPRLLYFGPTNLLWRCQMESRGLIFPNQSDHGVTTHMKSIVSLAGQHEMHNSSSILSKHWATIVENYSYRVVTFPKDRLPALAGVAKEFQALLNSQNIYVAGFWSDWLIKHLGWYRAEPPVKSDSPNIERRAPSWSWVSIHCQIRFEDIHTEAAVLVHYGIKLAIEEAPLGQVIRGGLTLLATIARHPLDGPVGLTKRSKIQMDQIRSSEKEEPVMWLYLGSTIGLTAICLILEPRKDGDFVRIGQARISRLDKVLLWPSSLTPQTITVV